MHEYDTGSYSNQDCPNSNLNEKAVFKVYIAKACLFMMAVVFCYVVGTHCLFLLSTGRNAGTIFASIVILALVLFLFIHAVELITQPLLMP